jgi:UDP-N-acetylmuramate dehydrogenase
MDMSESARMAGLRGTLRYDEPMAKHVSWRAGGRARIFFQPADVADLSMFLATLEPGEPVLFVGLGSNLLVRDGGFPGAVVFTHHTLTGIATDRAQRAELAFRAAAGVPAPHLARHVARHGGAGAEWMAGIPGTVGGALAMNAGCYGGETWDHVIAVETVDRAGTLRHRSPADYALGYRHVQLRGPGDEWFVSGVFGFAPGEEGAAMARIRELLQ